MDDEGAGVDPEHENFKKFMKFHRTTLETVMIYALGGHSGCDYSTLWSIMSSLSFRVDLHSANRVTSHAGWSGKPYTKEQQSRGGHSNWRRNEETSRKNLDKGRPLAIKNSVATRKERDLNNKAAGIVPEYELRRREAVADTNEKRISDRFVEFQSKKGYQWGFPMKEKPSVGSRHKMEIHCGSARFEFDWDFEKDKIHTRASNHIKKPVSPVLVLSVPLLSC